MSGLEPTTLSQSALAPSSPITEWHTHLDLQVRAGQMMNPND